MLHKIFVVLFHVVFSCFAFGGNDILSVELEYTMEDEGEFYWIRKSYNLLENQGRFISKTYKYPREYSEGAIDISVERIADFGLSNARVLFDAVASFYGNHPELIKEVKGLGVSDCLSVGFFTEEARFIIMKGYPSVSQEEADFWKLFESEVDKFQQSSTLVEETRRIEAIGGRIHESGTIVSVNEIQNSYPEKFDRQNLYIKGVLEVDEWGNMWLTSGLGVGDGGEKQILVYDVSLQEDDTALIDRSGELIAIEGILRWDEGIDRFTFFGRLVGEGRVKRGRA